MRSDASKILRPDDPRCFSALSASTTVVYEPMTDKFIAIVAVIRQGRDIPAILQKWAVPIRRELIDIRNRVECGEIRLPKRGALRVRRKK